MKSHPQKIQLDHPEPMRYPCRPMGLNTSSYMSLYSNFPESISTGSVPHHHYIKNKQSSICFPRKIHLQFQGPIDPRFPKWIPRCRSSTTWRRVFTKLPPCWLPRAELQPFWRASAVKSATLGRDQNGRRAVMCEIRLLCYPEISQFRDIFIYL